MNRFIKIFHRKKFLAMLSEMRVKLNAERAFGTLSFPFFMEKQAPVSGQKSMMSYECTYEGMLASSAGGMNLGYTGNPYDNATGLYNYGYRDYQPAAARFTTVDPIRDGNNWFAYVRAC